MKDKDTVLGFKKLSKYPEIIIALLATAHSAKDLIFFGAQIDDVDTALSAFYSEREPQWIYEIERVQNKIFINQEFIISQSFILLAT